MGRPNLGSGEGVHTRFRVGGVGAIHVAAHKDVEWVSSLFVSHEIIRRILSK